MMFNYSNLKYEFKDFVGIYENAFTQKECNDIIDTFKKFHKLGYTYNRNEILVEDTSSPDIIDLEWSDDIISSYHHRFYNYIYPLYNNYYSILQNIPSHRSTKIKIQKTMPTQGYHVWHCEHSSTSYKMNDRILSWILYLNDVEEGGETEFLYQSLRIKPKTGTFILFPAYFTHTHRGNPPLTGIKYIATGWVEFLHNSKPQGKFDLPIQNEIHNQINIMYN